MIFPSRVGFFQTNSLNRMRGRHLYLYEMYYSPEQISLESGVYRSFYGKSLL